jgi:hypothetical protein
VLTSLIPLLDVIDPDVMPPPLTVSPCNGLTAPTDPLKFIAPVPEKILKALDKIVAESKVPLKVMTPLLELFKLESEANFDAPVKL